ncbi:hypothetical protein BURPS1710b_3340 [Burkholderia pseudomallei 1710b]|uniref:Uncharacterized protein n=1 Tax=Burkholderia pseudomallei (strain 1710b) TaxID=320372 RepID=Q3JNZ3_BURP1|nr:hypothetical protein BURPS1710b_3340 [Burkholderia pseudomallei 1710b]
MSSPVARRTARGGSGSSRAPSFSCVDREDLAGVHQIARIERALDRAHRVDRVLAVFGGEKAHLVQPDAVLARAGAAHAQRALDDPVVERLRFGELLGLGRIDEDRDVEVAVADVAHDRTRQRRRVQIGLGFLDARGELRDRHADVGRHRAAAGLQLQHREIRVMARGPEARAILGARRPFEAPAAVLLGERLDLLRLLAHAGFGAVEFEEERGRLGEPELRVAVDRTHRERVDEFDARDRHADLDRLDHRARGGAHRAERAHGGRHGLGQRMQAQRDLGDHAERAFGSDEKPREIVAGRRFARAGARLHDAAVGEHGREAEHVLAHRAVAHRVRAGRARRGHPADARVRARIDREEQARVAQRVVQRAAREPGLDGRGQVVGVDRQHAVHLRQIERHAAAHREQMALERRADAVGDQRHVVSCAEEDCIAHVVGRACEHDGVGQLRIERRLVAAVMGAHRLRDRHARAEPGGERVDEGGGKRATRRRGGVVHASLLGGRSLWHAPRRGGPDHSTLEWMRAAPNAAAIIGISPTRRAPPPTANDGRHDGQSLEQDRDPHGRRRHDGPRRRQPRAQGRRADRGDRRRRRIELAARRAARRAAAGRCSRGAFVDPARPVRPGRRAVHSGARGDHRRASRAPGRLARALQRAAAAARGVHPAGRRARRRARARMPDRLPARGARDRRARRARAARRGAAPLREPAVGSAVRARAGAEPRGGRRRRAVGPHARARNPARNPLMRIIAIAGPLWRGATI